MTDLSVALEAMRSDANTWATAADRLDAPSAAITGLTLTGADLSRWAVDSGLDRTYEQARTALEDVVAQAGRAFHDLRAPPSAPPRTPTSARKRPTSTP